MCERVKYRDDIVEKQPLWSEYELLVLAHHVVKPAFATAQVLQLFQGYDPWRCVLALWRYQMLDGCAFRTVVNRISVVLVVNNCKYWILPDVKLLFGQGEEQRKGAGYSLRSYGRGWKEWKILKVIGIFCAMQKLWPQFQPFFKKIASIWNSVAMGCFRTACFKWCVASTPARYQICERTDIIHGLSLPRDGADGDNESWQYAAPIDGRDICRRIPTTQNRLEVRDLNNGAPWKLPN